MISNALLITGTDTDAGKTVLTTALIAYWQKYCQTRSLGVMKPLQTGIGDRELYRQIFDLDQTPEELNPLHFEAPLAPPIAADLEGKRVQMEPVWKAFEALRNKRDFVLVEALGGLGSPVTHETTVADWAWDWHLAAVLVVPVKLGAIGQAVANVALARQSKVHLRGIVLNCIRSSTDEEIENWASVRLIQRITGVPVLGLIPYLSDPTDVEKLAQVAANLDLEKMMTGVL
ncbi:ATP-dependent dethiobiotin synthetase BioD [Pseudanabaenaceae cyanobacterium LEGE 13415]|nr:ATP-dependent dethiobiotin synthetase BioD [Pseudanabaenaceae cyanobacterium LEGE 13415]